MCPRADASIGPHRVNVFFIIAHHPSAGQIYTPVPVCFFQKRRLTKHLSVDILGVQTAMLCKVYGIGQRKKGGTAMKRCPHCNSPITQPDRKTCPVCGNPLSGPTGAARRRLPPWVPVVLLCAVAVVVVYFALHKPVTLPADIQVPVETTPESAGLVLDEADRFYLDNLPTNITFTLTVDGAEQPHGTSDTGRYYMARNALTRTDTLLRVVSPEGDGYRTALALVSKPSNENAAFGTFVPCEADGYAKPDEEYLDAMLTVYYRAYLRAANAADPAELRYVTELHSQSLSAGIKSGATGAVTFTLDKSDMVCDTKHIEYGDNTVTVNAAASYEAVNDTTGEVETATDYYTIQAVWQDGMWLVDRSWMISESDYQNGVFGNQ